MRPAARRSGWARRPANPATASATAVPGQGILEFLRNAGSYRKVRTQKVDFLALPDIDYSRTRVIDDNWGGASDRVIVYVKEADIFVVFDIFKSLREEFFTLANLWHTRKILASGEHWYDTAYDAIAGSGGAAGPALPQDKRLLIVFPAAGFKLEGVEPQKRHYQDELTIHQTTGQHFELGETAGFVTVLVPHAAGADPNALAAAVGCFPSRAAGRPGRPDRARREDVHRRGQERPPPGHGPGQQAAEIHV